MVRRFAEDEIPAVYNRDEIPSTEIRDGMSMKNFRAINNSVGILTAEPGGETNLHQHPWEQIVYVLEGKARFYVDGEEFPIEAGDLFFVPPSTEHDLRPLDDEGVTVMAVWPQREDYDSRVDYQTEFGDE